MTQFIFIFYALYTPSVKRIGLSGGLHRTVSYYSVALPVLLWNPEVGYHGPVSVTTFRQVTDYLASVANGGKAKPKFV